MPLDAKPQPVRPMEATAAEAEVVTTQPAAQPPLEAEAAQDVHLRGGDLGVSCHMCHGHMSFYKSCC